MKNNNLKLYSLKKEDTDFEKIKVTNSKDCADYIKQFYSDDIEIYESCFILLLNRANYTIGYAKISQGGVAGTIVDVKIIAKYVIDSLACAVILAHNHPTGNLKASSADLAITDKVIKTLDCMDTKLLDHIILTKDSYLSLSDEGSINN
jgi:DNA repair protein RadC